MSKSFRGSLENCGTGLNASWSTASRRFWTRSCATPVSSRESLTASMIVAMDPETHPHHKETSEKKTKETAWAAVEEPPTGTSMALIKCFRWAARPLCIGMPGAGTRSPAESFWTGKAQKATAEICRRKKNIPPNHRGLPPSTKGGGLWPERHHR